MKRANDIRRETWLEINGQEYDCRVTFDYNPGCDSRTSGPPEDCYEGWPAELEITSVKVDGMEMLNALSSEKLAALDQRLMDDFEAWNPYEDYRS